jgi:hypothetical protein
LHRFILQKLVGQGLVLIQANGGVICRDLEPGETLRVSRGCLVAFESSVQYDVEMIKGVQNMMFSGQGLFLATMTGPGRVWVQSLPYVQCSRCCSSCAIKCFADRAWLRLFGADRFDRLVGAISKQLPGGGGGGMILPIGMGGGGGASGGDGTTPAATTDEAIHDSDVKPLENDTGLDDDNDSSSYEQDQGDSTLSGWFSSVRDEANDGNDSDFDFGYES